jgi:PAS domain S-box-containing protein
MADDGTRPNWGRGSATPRSAPTLLAPLALAAIVAAATTEMAIHHEVWPWMASAAGASLLAFASVVAYRDHDRRYRSLIDRVPVGLYRTSPAGRIVDANPALAHILGFASPADLLAAPAQSLYLDPEDRDRWVSRVNQADGAVEAELHMLRTDGRDIWVRDRVVPVRDRWGRVRCYEGELEDITEQRQHREQLEATLRSKIELIGAVSHELRTPLTSIVGYAHLLAEAGDLSEAERAEMAGVVQQQAEDVADIVEDLLAAAQADAGTLRVVLGPIDLGEEARRAVVGLAQRHTGTLELEAETAAALGDAMRVRQVVRNLVANAIVHGGDCIRVSTARVGHQARVTVADDGPGLAAGDEARVFEPFQRGSHSSAGHGSVGLGLTISRHLARLMGGDLTYRREDGMTVFRLVLPGRTSPAPSWPTHLRLPNTAPVG